MRIIIFTTLIIAFAMVSCTKTAIEKTVNRNISEGIYNGTFQRLGTNKGEADVIITFGKETFTGENKSPKYPAICNGRYSINGDTATFENVCVWTADFDWSYILRGKYKISFCGDTLVMTKDYNGIAYNQDIYKLIKQ